MGKPKDVSGSKYGRLTAIYRTKEKVSNGSYIWHCICECGNEKDVALCYLQRGATSSCGCLAEEQITKLIESKGGSRHPYRNHPVYSSWAGVVHRGKTDKVKNYEDVSVCDRWNPDKGGSFLNFLEDMGLPEEGQSINRVNGAKIYSKETCEWASRSIQGYDQKLSIRNKTGRVGVYQKLDGKYRAKITKDRKYIFLGDYESFEEACLAREEAEIKYFGFTKECR